MCDVETVSLGRVCGSSLCNVRLSEDRWSMSQTNKVPLWSRPLAELGILTAVQNAHTHTLLSWAEQASSATVLCLHYTGTSRSFSPAVWITSISCVTTSRTCSDASAVCAGCRNTRCHFTPQIPYRTDYITALYLVWVVRAWKKTTHDEHMKWKKCPFLQKTFINNWGRGEKTKESDRGLSVWAVMLIIIVWCAYVWAEPWLVALKTMPLLLLLHNDSNRHKWIFVWQKWSSLQYFIKENRQFTAHWWEC